MIIIIIIMMMMTMMMTMTKTMTMIMEVKINNNITAAAADTTTANCNNDNDNKCDNDNHNSKHHNNNSDDDDVDKNQKENKDTVKCLHISSLSMKPLTNKSPPLWFPKYVIPFHKWHYELFVQRLSMIELCLYAFPWLMEVYDHMLIADHHYTGIGKFKIQLWIYTIPMWNATYNLSVSMYPVQCMPVLGINDYPSHISQIILIIIMLTRPLWNSKCHVLTKR